MTAVRRRASERSRARLGIQVASRVRRVGAVWIAEEIQHRQSQVAKTLHAAQMILGSVSGEAAAGRLGGHHGVEKTIRPVEESVADMLVGMLLRRGDQGVRGGQSIGGLIRFLAFENGGEMIRCLLLEGGEEPLELRRQREVELPPAPLHLRCEGTCAHDLADDLDALGERLGIVLEGAKPTRGQDLQQRAVRGAEGILSPPLGHVGDIAADPLAQAVDLPQHPRGRCGCPSAPVVHSSRQCPLREALVLL